MGGNGGRGDWGNSGHSTRDVGRGGLWRDVVEENGRKMGQNTHFSPSRFPHSSGGRRSPPHHNPRTAHTDGKIGFSATHQHSPPRWLVRMPAPALCALRLLCPVPHCWCAGAPVPLVHGCGRIPAHYCARPPRPRCCCCSPLGFGLAFDVGALALIFAPAGACARLSAGPVRGRRSLTRLSCSGLHTIAARDEVSVGRSLSALRDRVSSCYRVGPPRLRVGQACAYFFLRKEEPPPPPPTKVTTVGNNEIYGWESLVGRFSVHKRYTRLGPRPPPPSSPPLLPLSTALGGAYLAVDDLNTSGIV